MMKRERVAGYEFECPHCHGDGEHRGPIPYRNCLRCGGFGTIVLIDPANAPVGKEAKGAE